MFGWFGNKINREIENFKVRKDFCLIKEDK